MTQPASPGVCIQGRRKPVSDNYPLMSTCMPRPCKPQAYRQPHSHTPHTLKRFKIYICKNPLNAFHFCGGYSSVRQVKLLAKLTSDSASLWKRHRALLPCCCSPWTGSSCITEGSEAGSDCSLGSESCTLLGVGKGGYLSISPNRAPIRAWHRKAAGPRGGLSGGQLHCPVFELGMLGPQQPCTECSYVDGFKGELWKLLALERVLLAL